MEALLIILPKKSEGQPRTYRHRKLTFICPAGPCPAETSAASAQLKYTSRRIVTETRPIRNTVLTASDDDFVDLRRPRRCTARIARDLARQAAREELAREKAGRQAMLRAATGIGRVIDGSTAYSST
jgi:hypothetical protein